MNQQSRLLRIILFTQLLLFTSVSFSDIPRPEIPKGRGDQCVEDTDVMRRNHMNLILHQRDETVHNGIRTKQHSFKECINCHVVKDNNSKPVSIASDKHFCNVCHTYAAVKIDCFECHASKPSLTSLGTDR